MHAKNDNTAGSADACVSKGRWIDAQIGDMRGCIRSAYPSDPGPSAQHISSVAGAVRPGSEAPEPTDVGQHARVEARGAGEGNKCGWMCAREWIIMDACECADVQTYGCYPGYARVYARVRE